MQSLIVALLVVGCSLYAAWTLAPKAAQRALAAGLLRLKLPAAIATKLGRVARASGGCSCDGCDAGNAAPRKPQGGPAPLRFHPRRR
ncbi:MAG TPA: DUF6587 family protein [Methylibium sp.]